MHFLPPDVCAQRIVQGVITNQKFLYIPKSYRLLEFVKRSATQIFFLCHSNVLPFSFLPYDAFKAILSYVLNVHDPNLTRNRARRAPR